MHEMILILLIKDGFEWETPKCKVLDKFSFQWYQWILWNVNSLPRSTIKLELEGFVGTHSEVRTWSFSVHLEENLEKKWQAGKNPCTELLLCTSTCLLFAVCWGERSTINCKGRQQRSYKWLHVLYVVFLTHTQFLYENSSVSSEKTAHRPGVLREAWDLVGWYLWTTFSLPLILWIIKLRLPKESGYQVYANR